MHAAPQNSSAKVESQTNATPSADSSPDLLHMGHIERINLGANLALIGQRLTSLESRLQQTDSKSPKSSSWLEFAKVLFGGWPAFGLLFMLLFYVPVRDAINAIPEKVKSADEIGVLGVSLKNTIRDEAAKIGSLQLSETLPTLSPAAVDFMLRGSRGYNGLVAFNKENEMLKSIWLPNEQTLKILEELESKKLVSVHLANFNSTGESVADISKAIASFRQQYPMKQEGYGSPEQIVLELTPPAKAQIPNFSWQLTDLGKNAVNVILKAVSAQLTPRPQSRK